MKTWTSLFLLLVLASAASAQPPDSLKAQLTRDWQRAKLYTDEFMDAMPAGDYGFRATDSVRSFAQQLIHMAQGTVSLMNAASGRPVPPIINRTNLEKTASTLTADSARYFVRLSYDYAIAAVAALSADSLWKKENRGRFSETRFAWMLKAFEHQTHHRGQLVIYLRLKNIRPPFERIF